MAGKMTPGRRAAVRKAIARRGAKKLTQEDLAGLAGVSLRTVQNFESGEVWSQSATLTAIEENLGWPEGYLEEFAARRDEELDRHASAHGPADWLQARQALEAVLDTLEDDFPNTALPNG